MNIAMIRIGVDAGCGGIQSPLFKDGSFEFIPIPENPDIISKYKYGSLIGRKGRPLADYFPPRRRDSMALSCVHCDPDWHTFTYGDYTGGPKSGLRKLEKGDILMFTCGLEGWDFDSPPAIYLIGYFVVTIAGTVSEFSLQDIKTLFWNNAHVRGKRSKKDFTTWDGSELILVKGSSKSRLLKKAVLLSNISRDSKNRPLKVLSLRMQKIMGNFGGKTSIQRSPTRWIDNEHVGKTAEYLLSLK
jgi:hypothetical protein